MIAALVSLGALAVCATPTQTLGDVLALLRKPISLTADFVQTKSMKMLREPMKSRGRLYILEPSRLKWELIEPYKMTFIVAESKASMVYPDLGKKRTFDINEDPETKSLFETILLFTDVDEVSLQQRFTVEMEPGDEPKITLIPRAEAARKVIVRVELWVDANKGVLRKLAMTQASGTQTIWVFENVKVDPPLPASLFEP